MRINLRAGVIAASAAVLGVMLLAAPANARPIADQTVGPTIGLTSVTPQSAPYLVPGGTYTIHNASGKCLEIENSVINNGAQAQQWDCVGQPGMYWRIYENPQFSGIYRFVNRASGRCLEIEGSSYNNGARAQQWDCVGQAGANWHFPNSGTDGTWILNASGKCLEIEGSSYNNGARAQQWDCVYQHGAIWTLAYCDPNAVSDTCTHLPGQAAATGARTGYLGTRPSMV
jgi:hypothetical protein